jgi:hypothetical protein
MLRILASVAALALATPAAAEDSYWESDNWLVSVDSLHNGKPYCSLIGAYSNDEIFAVHFSAITNQAMLVFILSMADAANFSPSLEHTFAVTFVVGDTLDKGWGDRIFEVDSDDEGNTRMFTSSNMEAEVLLNDLARADTIAFTMHEGQRIVAAFELKGTATAIDKLRECGYSRVVP